MVHSGCFTNSGGMDRLNNQALPQLRVMCRCDSWCVPVASHLPASAPVKPHEAISDPAVPGPGRVRVAFAAYACEDICPFHLVSLPPRDPHSCDLLLRVLTCLLQAQGSGLLHAVTVASRPGDTPTHVTHVGLTSISSAVCVSLSWKAPQNPGGADSTGTLLLSPAAWALGERKGIEHPSPQGRVSPSIRQPSSGPATSVRAQGC